MIITSPTTGEQITVVFKYAEDLSDGDVIFDYGQSLAELEVSGKVVTMGTGKYGDVKIWVGPDHKTEWHAPRDQVQVLHWSNFIPEDRPRKV